MKRNQEAKRRSDRRGIALVVVLGILSVLMLLAVAFAISMRVERLAARNYRDVVQARQLIHAGLARAVTELNRAVTNIYPSFTALSSWVSGGEQCTDLLIGGVTNYIPGVLLEDALDDCLDPSAPMTWEPIAWGGDTALVARVAWACINCSGLLDASEVDKENRGPGESPGEIQTAGLPEMMNAAEFRNNTHNAGYYETLRDVWTVNKGSGLSDPPEHFFTYSSDPDQYWHTNAFCSPGVAVSNKLNLNAITLYPDSAIGKKVIGMKDFDDLSPGEREELHDILLEYFYKAVSSNQAAGTASGRPGDMGYLLINYIDSDNLPEDSDANYTECEAVDCSPMINEIAVDIDSTGAGVTNYVLKVECWFPFVPVTVEDGEYKLIIDVLEQDDRCNDPGHARNRANCLWTSERDESPSRMTLGAMSYPGHQYEVIETSVIPALGERFKEAPDKFGTVGCAWIRTTLIHVGTGTIVDQAPGWRGGDKCEQIKYDGYGCLPFPCIDGPGYGRGPAGSYAINDPRWNYARKGWQGGGNLQNPKKTSLEFRQPGKWCNPGQMTLGDMNDICHAWDEQSLATDYRGVYQKPDGLPIYIRNGPLESIGELGFLYMSNPLSNRNPDRPPAFWLSLDMFDEQMRRILDWFTIQPVNEPVARGRVNINTRHPAVLKALLEGIKVEQYPGAPDSKTLSSTAVDKIVDAIIEGGPYTNVSDIGRIEELQDSVPSVNGLDPKNSDHARESLLRGIIQLITVQDTVYSIVVTAQIAMPDPDGTPQPIAEQKAVATVWRDAYTGKTHLRSLKWLAD